MRAIKQAAARLEPRNRELKHFVSAVSHDLGEPLRAVRGFTELLQDVYRDKLERTALGKGTRGLSLPISVFCPLDSITGVESESVWEMSVGSETANYELRFSSPGPLTK